MPEKVEECVESVLEDNPNYSERRAWAICQAQVGDKAGALEVYELSTLDIKEEHLEELDDFSEKEDGVWVSSDEQFIVYNEEKFSPLGIKGEFEGYTLSTDGDPGDEEAFKSFLDALVDEGADVWQVRNGELYVWPDDDSSFPRHDPRIKVIGIPRDDFEDVLERFNVEFMGITDGV